jgi:hypothetical protein
LTFIWETRQQSEERKHLDEMAQAQEERARAIANTERAQFKQLGRFIQPNFVFSLPGIPSTSRCRITPD